ncbi:hypothetical protein [Jatrophihabitans sp.]|uniref:hypothetical protein n=1 Tax=Jatrophihabitans sp. TaxID=1932789 RepID=UPI0030C707C4|nr:hypothetical protein [Jatrophihabitans sp.]
MRHLLAAVTLAALVTALLSGCSASSVTATRLDTSVGPAFARLYGVQQHQLGNTVGPKPDGTAACARNNKAHPSSGSGDDWACVLNFPFADGHIQPITYDVSVQPDGCYTADGPSQIVGQQQVGSSGETVTNPLFEFDGCFPVG